MIGLTTPNNVICSGQHKMLARILTHLTIVGGSILSVNISKSPMCINVTKFNNRLKLPWHKQFVKNVRKDKYFLLLLVPAIIYYIVFCYTPIYGTIIAFKDFNPAKGILASPWAGFKYFEQFFHSIYFTRLLRNSLLLSVYGILWGFPIPIIFALMLNEIKDGLFKRLTQTVSYLPHFISLVVVVGMMMNLMSSRGVINMLLQQITGNSIDFLTSPDWFRTLYVGSGIWQEFGWGAIIYLAALSSINPEQYEAAKVDGANRLKQIYYITLPGLMPTIAVLLILSVGSILGVGYEKIILMYAPSNYETSDVLSSYVYRAGILNAQFSLGAAVDLFNSTANLMLLVTFNRISGKLFETRLW